MQEEAPIGLVEHQVCRFIAQPVAVQLMRAMGLVQFAEEQRLAVVGPGHAAVAILERQAGYGAGAQLFDVQLINLFTTGIKAVGKPLMIWANAERAPRKKAAGGQYVRVQQQLLIQIVDSQ